MEETKGRGIRYTSDEEVRSALLQFLLFIIFLILTTIVTLSVRHSYMFYFNNTIDKLLVDRDITIAPSVTINFGKLVTVNDFWDYLQLGFLSTFHGEPVEPLPPISNDTASNDTESESDSNPDPTSAGKEETVENVNQPLRTLDEKYADADDDDYNDAEQYGESNGTFKRFKRAQPRKGGGGGGSGGGSSHHAMFNESVANLQGRIFLTENVLLGPPRLRQIRVKKDSCYVNDAFIRYFNTCYAEYTPSIEDTEPEYKGTKFYTQSEVSASSIWAQIKNYEGAGYIQDLTYERSKNEEILTKLRESKWLDRGSRMVLLEFNLYNENTDIFQIIKLIAELPPTGGVLPSSNLQTVKEYSFFTEKSLSLMIVVALFYIMNVYYTIMEFIELKKIGIKRYLRSSQNYLDMTIMLFAYLGLAYNIWHTIVVRKLEKDAEASVDYQSLDVIGYWNFIYVDMMAILGFLVWIRIFKFISFNKTLVQFTTTLRRCAKDLAGFSLMFLIVFLAYAQLGLLLFGTKHPDFKNFITSVLTMIRMILGDFQYELIEKANRILGPIYFLTYILLVFFILLNMFLAIIMETYNTVKSEITHGRSQLGAYLLRKIKWLYKIIRYCGRQRDRQRATFRDEVVAPSDKVIQIRKSTTTKDKYLEDVPPGVHNKDLYRLSNRVALLEEVLEQLVTNMDNILKRVERENASKKKG